MVATTITPSLANARPGVEVADRAADALASAMLWLRIEHVLGRPAWLEVSFAVPADRQGEYSPDDFAHSTGLDLGSRLRVHTAPDRSVALFDGKVVEIEYRYPHSASPQLAVTAADPMHLWCLQRKVQQFIDMSEQNLLQMLADERGATLDYRVSGAMPRFATLTQFQESDLDLLRRLATMSGADFWWQDGGLQWQSRDLALHSNITVRLGDALRSFAVSRNLGGQLTRVEATGWDVSSKRDVAAATEYDRGDRREHGSGPARYSGALGERSLLLANVAADDGRARWLAESAYRQHAARFVQARGEVDASQVLQTGRKIEVRGVGKSMEGDYYVTGVVHRFDSEQGLRTAFSADQQAAESAKENPDDNEDRRSGRQSRRQSPRPRGPISPTRTRIPGRGGRAG